MEYCATVWNLLGIPWNTMEYHQYHGTLYNIMECHGIHWNTVEYNAVPWNTMEYHGIQWKVMEHYFCGISWIIMKLNEI